MAREGEFRKEGRASRTQLVNLCVQSFEVSRDTFTPWLEKASRWYKAYRGFRQGKAHPYHSNLTIPLAFSMIQSDASKKTGILVGRQPYMTFVAVGPEDKKLARKREALVNLQLDDCDTFDKATKLFTGGAIYGTMPYRTFWDTKYELVNFRADFGGGERAFTGEEMTFDGPNWEPVSPFDFFPAPRYWRIREMPWVVHRYYLDREDVNRLVEAGFYDRQARSELEMGDGGQPPDDVTTAANEDPATGGIEAGYRKTDFDRPVEILEWWGRVPRDFAIEGQVSCVITVANRKVLLRHRINPHGKIPFGEYSPMPDPRYWHAPSKVEVIEKLQVATNSFASQKADALAMFANPQFLYNRRGIVDARKLISRPGAWHGFDGEVGDNQVRPLVPDLRGLVNLYTELEQHSRWMQQGTGVVEDTMQGFAVADRETARSFVGRQEASGTRLLMEARVAERLWFEPLAQDFVRLNRQFLSFPREVRMLGASAILDPWTLQPIPSETATLSINDMLPDYDARAVGATRSISSGALFERMAGIQQLAQTNPFAVQMINWFNWFRQLFYVAELPNPDELLGTDSIIQQVMVQAAQGMLQQAATGATGVPMQQTPTMKGGGNVTPLPVGQAPTAQTSVNR